jgi:hypothetical protein
VCVDQAGQHERAIQIQAHCTGQLDIVDVVVTADSDDAVIGNRQGSRPRLRRVDCVDVGVCEDRD